MVVNYILHGFLYLYGSLNTELIKQNLLLPNNFSTSEETLVYPPNLYLIGRKQISLINENLEKTRMASIELIFSKIGFYRIIFSVEITVEEYSTIESKEFSTEDPNFLIKKETLQQISMQFAKFIFGKSMFDMQLDHDLNTDYFKQYCEKYGFIPGIERNISSISSYVSITDKEEWEKIKKIEMEKCKGGSVLRTAVAIPNFDNTSFSQEPDIDILNSLNIIIYANDFLIRDTVYLALGIKYKFLGLFFIKDQFMIIQTNLLEIQNYYENPGKNPISWIYIDRAVTKLENKFDKLIAMYELEFLNFDDPNYFIMKNPTFMEDVNQLLEYNSTKKNYLEIKNHTKELLSALRFKISDKGEKEEHQAYNRIVAIVGLLAIFQIFPTILPLFSQSILIGNYSVDMSNLIRIVFLIIFFPSLLVIWYVTSYNNQRKIKSAEKIEHQKNLISQKQRLIDNIAYYKGATTQEVLKLSKLSMEYQITFLEKKIEELELELKKFKI